MGTSKSLSTPSGGGWTSVKYDITDSLGGNTDIKPEAIVGGTISAAGGLLGSAVTTGSLAGAAGGSHAPDEAGGARRAGARARHAAVGRALSRLSGFGSVVETRGLDEGLRSLGLEALQGRPAAEVIAAIADHLAGSVDGLAGEVLTSALRRSIFEAAELAGDPTYENLESALQGFLATDGVDGLAELFLADLAFDRVWSLIENHVEQRSETTTDATALADAIKACCRSQARLLIDQLKAEGRFDTVDWFGRDGQRFGNEIAGRMEAQLIGLKE